LAGGELADLKAGLERKLAESRAQKDGHRQAMTLLFLGGTELSLGNNDGAKAGFNKARRRCRSCMTSSVPGLRSS
jgi:hypothetical protein